MLEEADILSVLIFGKPASGLSDSEQASLQGQAIQATAGYVASGLRRSIANKLGVDNLEFDMGQSIGQGEVSVGKYVLKDVYVTTSQHLGEEHEQEVSLEYQINRQWQVKGTTTSRGTSGVDIFWQKRFRTSSRWARELSQFPLPPGFSLPTSCQLSETGGRGEAQEEVSRWEREREGQRRTGR